MHPTRWVHAVKLCHPHPGKRTQGRPTLRWADMLTDGADIGLQ
jgi:hypothetical protein